MSSNRSPDFRFYPADSVSFGFNDNGCKLIFAIEEQDRPPTEQVGVYMTPRTLKILGHIINTTITNYESTAGPIPVDQVKMDEITESLSVVGASDTE